MKIPRINRKIFLIIGIVILAFFLVMALFPRMFSSIGRKESFSPWLAPSHQHLLGTNSLGYDIYTELVYGCRDTILVGLCSSLLTLVLGFVIGILSTGKGFVGTIFDGLINIFALFPRLVAVIVLAGFTGRSLPGMILLISAFSWVTVARGVRVKVLHILKSEYIEICRLYGYSRLHTALYHILPNLKDVLLSKFLSGITSCIMMESSLSFLGFGDVYYPTWGVMINFARNRGALIRGAYNYLLSPCICIMLLSLAFYFISIYIEERQNVIKSS